MPPPREPQRRCVACRTIRPKRELIRVQRAPDGSMRVDARGTAPGRGAYVCRARECVELAARRNAFVRALGGDRASEAIRLELEEALGGSGT